MSNSTHTDPDQPPPPEISHRSRLAWWLHPKVALPLSLLALILLSPFLYRGYRIASVPDIGDPFDVAAFEAIEVPASDNAAVIYAAANAMRISCTSADDDDLDRVLENGWADVTEALQKLLTANERALDEWRRGTERPTAQFLLAKEVSIDSYLPMVHELREFSRLARLRAEQCLHEGDVVEAWNWLRASVRTNRHLGQHGSIIERLTGTATFNLTVQGINRWAADPLVNENHLRKAAEQFDVDDAMTPLTSEGLKSDYVCYLHSIDRSVPLAYAGISPAGVPEGGLASFMFVMGEPEYSRRLMQQVFAGWLENLDLPKWKRGIKAAGILGLYPPAPKPGRIPAPELESRVLSFNLSRNLLPALSTLEKVVDRDAARRAALKPTLAAQCFHRLHGDWPGKLGDLVPDFIKELPADPLGKAGETLLLKRDGDDLIIYSIGDNGLDDGGAIAPVGDELLDVGYRLNRPQSPPAEK